MNSTISLWNSPYRSKLLSFRYLPRIVGRSQGYKRKNTRTKTDSRYDNRWANQNNGQVTKTTDARMDEIIKRFASPALFFRFRIVLQKSV